MNSKSIYILLIGIFSLLGCSYFVQEDTHKPVARVNDAYLYEEDILGILPENLSTQDSALFVNNYVTHWATEQLLLDQAKLNLEKEQQEGFERLVNDYRKELYTEAYKDMIISKELDTMLEEEMISSYFEANKGNFKLNQDLVKLRYIHLSSSFPKIDKIKEKFKRYNEEDKVDLENESLKFNSFSFNDSVWVSARSIYNEIGPLSEDDKSEFLKKDNFMQHQDSLGVYLVNVKDVLFRNENAPLEYVRPTIKQILLNKRKLELSKKLEKDITKDALKNNKFEIYN